MIILNYNGEGAHMIVADLAFRMKELLVTLSMIGITSMHRELQSKFWHIRIQFYPLSSLESFSLITIHANHISQRKKHASCWLDTQKSRVPKRQITSIHYDLRIRTYLKWCQIIPPSLQSTFGNAGSRSKTGANSGWHMSKIFRIQAGDGNQHMSTTLQTCVTQIVNSALEIYIITRIIWQYSTIHCIALSIVKRGNAFSPHLVYKMFAARTWDWK